MQRTFTCKNTNYVQNPPNVPAGRLLSWLLGGNSPLPSGIGMHRGGVNGRAFVEVFLKEHKLPATLRSVRFVGASKSRTTSVPAGTLTGRHGFRRVCWGVDF